MSLLLRAAALALCGAVAGGACLTIAYGVKPDLTFDMDTDMPATARGFYAVERNSQYTYVWTSGLATVRFDGLDRRLPWSCAVRFSGARPSPALPQPDLQVAADGVTLGRWHATNDFQDVEVTVPARPVAPGLTLTLASTPVFVPGSSDQRELGVQLDRLSCHPVGAAIFPPTGALWRAAISVAAFALALGLVGIGARAILLGILAIAVGQALPLSTGGAPYGLYPATMMTFALWIAFLMAMTMKALSWRTGSRLPAAAAFVIAFSAGALYLQLLGLFHPSKNLVDAVFHAHRFEAVLRGNYFRGDYFFTQPMPGGVTFPYAVGLYVAAIPWSMLTHDHVALLRILVCATTSLAGACLYPAIVRTWGDRLAGAIAAGLFTVVPLPFGVIGNANLTNAFGQAVALLAIVAVVVWSLQPRQILQLIALVALISLALLSHVSTFALLLGMLLTTVVCYAWQGGQALRATTRSVLLATVVAVAFSVVSYYGHFGDVYAKLGRVRATAAVPAPDAGAWTAPGPATSSSPTAPASPDIGPSLGARVFGALRQMTTDVGWPVICLAFVGALSLWMAGARDRLALVLAAWGITWVVFVVFVVRTHIGAEYGRYAAEFLSRVNLATYPALVILAARGAVWAWRAPRAVHIARFGVIVLLLSAAGLGMQSWLNWFHPS